MSGVSRVLNQGSCMVPQHGPRKEDLLDLAAERVQSLCVLWDTIIPYRTGSVHFWAGLMNSATTHMPLVCIHQNPLPKVGLLLGCSWLVVIYSR